MLITFPRVTSLLIDRSSDKMCDISPKTVIFGGGKEKPTLSLKASWSWYETDENVETILANEQPQVIVSIGEDTNFSNLCALPLHERKRWLAFSNFEEITDDKLIFCMMSQVHKAAKKKRESEVLISVFTPSFKSGHRIMRPFQSLLDQTYRRWEWIIIDDTDEKTDDGKNWAQLCDLAKKDYRIRPFKPSQHSGIIGALKRDAAFLGKGELLVELDHDDEIHPDTFQMLVDAYKQFPDAGMFYTDYAEVMEGTDANFAYGEYFSFGYGAYSKQRYQGKWRNMVHTSLINYRTMRYIIGVPNHLRVWTAKAYHEMGGHSPLLHVADDYELIMRTFLRYQMVRIPKLCYIQYRNEGGNNFTFIRNAEIQKLTKQIARFYDQDITNRLKELGLPEVNNYSTPQNWHNIDDHNLDKRADVFALVPEDMVSVIVVVEKHHTISQITATVTSLFQQSHRNIEVVVVGNKCPLMEDALNFFEEENLKWWNLKEEDEEDKYLSLNYALKMLSVGNYVFYLTPGLEWNDFDYVSNYLSKLKETRKNDSCFLVGDDISINTLSHTRNIPTFSRYWSNTMSEHDTILLWKWNFDQQEIEIKN